MPLSRCSCPHLNEENLCSIYERRYRDGAPDEEQVALVTIGKKNYALMCGKINLLHESGRLEPEVAKQCCFIHPELLEGDYEGTN